jgi:colanic acid/amylovoran biosynthesis protein
MTALRPVKIGLFWHSVNSGNLGVGALTESNLGLLRAEAETLGIAPQFTIICFRDQEPAYIGGPDIEVLPLSSRDLLLPWGLWRTLGGLDRVFDIGGGDSWTDIYPVRRFGFLWLSKMMASVRRVPWYFSPQTIGPFTKQPWRFLAKLAMRRARAIVARDPVSAQVAAEMVPGAKIIESVDVAFALPFVRAPAHTDGKVHVGINVSGLLYNRGYGGDNAFGLEADYAALTQNLLNALTERPDIAVHLFTHVVAPAWPEDDDARIANTLAMQFPSVQREADFASPSAAKSFISGLDFVVSGRMHACIAAYSSGVPVVPIAYSRKFSGLFEGVLAYHHAVPVSGLSTDAALAHILDRLDRRDDLAAEIAVGNRTVAAALDRYRHVIREALA